MGNDKMSTFRKVNNYDTATKVLRYQESQSSDYHKYKFVSFCVFGPLWLISFSDFIRNYRISESSNFNIFVLILADKV